MFVCIYRDRYIDTVASSPRTEPALHKDASIRAYSNTGPDAKTYILLSLLGELDTKTSKDPGYATEFKFQGK